MDDAPLIAHSLAEVYYYLRATTCAECGKGPLENAHTETVGEEDEHVAVVVKATCRACRMSRTLNFRVPAKFQAIPDDEPITINDTAEASRIVDVAQWIVLARLLAEDAKTESDKVKSRRLKLAAVKCLDEALKFYDEVDNDLPPLEAFFNEGSRRRFQDHPDRFSKKRLIDWRSTLPSPTSALSPSLPVEPKPKNRWWRRKP
ncbi:MAG: hypothetical protein KJ749_04530 [Planctomycetes bacterium]|nr:hypothetical protein [Planctomycetota bacterium]